MPTICQFHFGFDTMRVDARVFTRFTAEAQRGFAAATDHEEVAVGGKRSLAPGFSRVNTAHTIQPV